MEIFISKRADVGLCEVCVCMYVKPCFEHACVPNCRVLQLSMANVHWPV